jgi:phosphatidylserine/phosphatidylglycerophosphate/cardiolipin synthase-like enzyme
MVAGFRFLRSTPCHQDHQSTSTIAAQRLAHMNRNPIPAIALAALLGLPMLSSATPSVQVGFSPEGSARQLVLDTITSARTSIQILAYAFQAPDIAQALVDARQRGVLVRIVVDKKRNTGKASQAAMDLVVRNGIELRTNDRFHIHHDKAMIVDGDAVETGSFNYAPSAETANSENVVVIRGMPEVTQQYLQHWQSRWKLGVPYPVR